MTDRPDDAYADTRAHIDDELCRVDLLLRRHLEAWWADRDGRPGDAGDFYVSDEEVDRLLDTGAEAATNVGHATRRSPGDGGRYGDDGRLAHVTDVVRDRVVRSVEAGVDLRLVALVEAFDLSALERDALLLALAPDLDRKYEKVYGYLRDDVTNVRPTVALVRRVLAGPDADRLALVELLDDRSTLVSERLVEVVEGPTLPASDVRVRERVIEFLLGSDAVPGAIADATTVVEPTETLSGLAVGDDRRRTLADLRRRLDDEGAPAMAAFVGPDERTATAAVEGVCDADGPPVLRVDARSLSPDRFDEQLAVLRREARLRGCPVHVASLDALQADGPRRAPADEERPGDRADPDRLERVVVALDSLPGQVFLTGDAPVSAALQPRLGHHEYVQVEFPRPDYERRKDLWKDVEGLPDDADPAALAGMFRLTRGQVEDAVETARSLADGPLAGEALREGCRMHAREDLEDLAREVEPTYGWDDIVLPADTLAHLREVAAQVRHRGTVFEGWGFEERFSLGNGINLLFTGPSGTGKTMAAEIIAGDAGLPMYKLDLSNVLSKYIGETEENIGRVFDQAEHSNAILFFDEADALFGERTEIGDSRDRYANVEVDYLLQRMEEHDGCVVMASNLKENIDDAFRRRINAAVEFPMPDADARRDIWASIFPAETPREDLDLEFLAAFELAGGAIKNVALTAAFMAAEDGDPVGMDHLVRALRREFQKTGKLYDADSFGEYRDALE